MQVIQTYSYRIKDSSSRKYLCRMAGAVNFVWNYCNEVAHEMWGRQRHWVTAFDLNNLTSGAAKELPINSQSIQAIAKEYVTRRNQSRKRKLRWRSKKNLGWIPFNGQTVALASDTIKYRGMVYRFWLSRPIPEGAKLVTGSFNQDAQGRWYVNLQFKIEMEEPQPEGERRIGIDLGLKTQATCSDGEKLERPNLTKEWEDKLAVAQRAGKKKRVKKIHAKIRNKRQDWNHKESTKLIKSSRVLRVGNVSASRLMKTRMAKSVADAGWFQFKEMLKYKAITHGVDLEETNEAYSTVTCSHCLERTGPRGVRNLGIRDWMCSNCGTSHDRDVNAAKNILIFGMVGRPNAGRLPLPSGIAAGAGGSKERQVSLFPLGHERPN